MQETKLIHERGGEETTPPPHKIPELSSNVSMF